MSGKKFKFLIADTTAFINNVQLQEYAEIVLTVPDVVNEVKNKRQIRRLVVLPFNLQIREPLGDSLKYVTEFAKKTGDFASLSAIDLKVIALTYELEKQHHGTEHLRSEPVVRRVITSKSKPEEFVDKTPLVGFYKPHDTDTGEKNAQDDESSLNVSNEEVLRSVEHLAECMEKIGSLEDSPNASEETDTINVDQILVPQSEGSSEDDECSSGDSDDDDSNWITPSNLQSVKEQFKGESEEDKVVAVACMSTDYAIQNVLKQINLNIAALNGRVIKQLRTYILRCYACFKTTSVMTKVFCPYCGNKTLKRVAVSLDENGQQVIHINLRRPLTKKYKNQSLPRPRGGKHSHNPILVEDQPIPKQMPSRVAKTKTNALDENYIAGYSPFVMRDVNSKSAILRTEGNIKQLARNNMYEENRRKKRSSRLVK